MVSKAMFDENYASHAIMRSIGQSRDRRMSDQHRKSSSTMFPVAWIDLLVVDQPAVVEPLLGTIMLRMPDIHRLVLSVK